MMMLTLLVLLATPALEQVTTVPVPAKALPGLVAEMDQAFRVKGGPLDGRLLFFASVDRDGAPTAGRAPSFVVASGKDVLAITPLPGLIEGWNVVKVLAVGTTAPPRKDVALRVLAVLTLEPMSGRSSDYWNQGFVIDLFADGHVVVDAALNKALAEAKPRPETIKAMRAFLAARR